MAPASHGPAAGPRTHQGAAMGSHDPAPALSQLYGQIRARVASLVARLDEQALRGRSHVDLLRRGRGASD
ncbi:MAG: hypothetical protein ACLQU9_01495 [Acidimicrobiales bacterium]